MKNKICKFYICKRKASSLGLCPTHWKQQNAGKKLTPIRKYGNNKTQVNKTKKIFQRNGMHNVSCSTNTKKKRMCLRCKKMFLSKCAANRFCKGCKIVIGKKRSSLISNAIYFDRKLNGEFILSGF